MSRNNHDTGPDVRVSAAFTFINVLFAVAAAALLVVMLEECYSPWARVIWVVFDATIVFWLWKQYLDYELPLQVSIRPPAQGGLDDVLSYSIAMVTTGLVAASSRSVIVMLGLCFLLTVITIGKVVQMKYYVETYCPHAREAVTCLSQRLPTLSTILLFVLTVLGVRYYRGASDDPSRSEWVPVSLFLLYLILAAVSRLKILGPPISPTQYARALQEKTPPARQ